MERGFLSISVIQHRKKKKRVQPDKWKGHVHVSTPLAVEVFSAFGLSDEKVSQYAVEERRIEV